MVGYARAARFPAPGLAAVPAALWLLAGALSVAVGVWPDVGALMLAAWNIPTAIWFHAFWKAEDEQKQLQQQLFFRNLTFLGPELALFGLFVALADQLRFVVTAPLLSF